MPRPRLVNTKKLALAVLLIGPLFVVDHRGPLSRASLLFGEASSEFDDEEGDLSHWTGGIAEDHLPDYGKECGLWFAQSTIPGAGWGMFAGREYQEDDIVTAGDLVVPLIEISWHVGYENGPDNLWAEYQWSGKSFTHMTREGEKVSGASFGIGAVPNCLLPLVQLAIGDTSMDAAGLHRSRDPGAGAFTPYHDRFGYAEDRIPAGMELFVNYGSNYFRTREELYGKLPMDEDYEVGDELIDTFKSLMEGRRSDDDNTCAWGTADACQAEENATLHPPLGTTVQSRLLELMQFLASLWKSGPLMTLPAEPELVDYLHEHGTSHMYYNRSIRELDWLQEHGFCMDNIRVGLSTIPQAGRGAFATRSIRKGELVTIMPLIHIPDRDIYKMYDTMHGVKEDDPLLVRNTTAAVHWQLMINYCFGHRQSSLLLCPYGVLSTAINHSKERMNSKIQWNDKATRHHDWMEQDIEEWGSETHAGLAFELVATRDIDKGEEIFMDYGDEWAAAWDEHVAKWRPPSGAETYFPAREMNEMIDEPVMIASEGVLEIKDKSLFCRDIYRGMRGHGGSLGDVDYHYCRPVHRYKNADGEYRYIVEITKVTKDEKKRVCWDDVVEILFDFPRSGFFWRDAYYSRDHCQRWSFRHDLRIPDDIMPETWLNLEEPVVV